MKLWNVGFINPTYTLLEAHLFDFADNLYGQRLRIDFLHKLRDEAKFPGLPELQAQIAADIAHARDWLAQHQRWPRHRLPLSGYLKSYRSDS
nr:riboflavin kinase [Eikenella corrodens]